ncbi:hypothetical protein ACIQNG_38145 [Streptomyces sp. NPDC091377]|uniref:hypothetical protein n=1 Tax=Streptomyces sp. NPDC091377 TaxID=3365995 RepID=UPI003824FCDF
MNMGVILFEFEFGFGFGFGFGFDFEAEAEAESEAEFEVGFGFGFGPVEAWVAVARRPLRAARAAGQKGAGIPVRCGARRGGRAGLGGRSSGDRALCTRPWKPVRDGRTRSGGAP